MIPFQILTVAFGTWLIRILQAARRKLTGEDKYFSFSDFLIEERHVKARGFIYMALPPAVAGCLISVFPSVHPIVPAGAGFCAAFLGVWPVFKFPYYLLDEYLLDFWPKLKFLYVIFLGFSTALCYSGFVVGRMTIPLLGKFAGTSAWQTFLDNIAANALYDVAKAAFLALLMVGGIYVNRERSKIGGIIETRKHSEWEQQVRELHENRDE